MRRRMKYSSSMDDIERNILGIPINPEILEAERIGREAEADVDERCKGMTAEQLQAEINATLDKLVENLRRP